MLFRSPGLYTRRGELRNGSIQWIDESIAVTQRTLTSCCLVSRDWNRTFTPVLYGEIPLGGKDPILTQSLLHRTLRYIKPTHKVLVKTMTISPAVDGSTATLLSICFSMPNLHKLTLNFKERDLSTLHPRFVQLLRSLSKSCTIQMAEDHKGLLKASWGSLPRYINFMRLSGLTVCGFVIHRSGGR